MLWRGRRLIHCSSICFWEEYLWRVAVLCPPPPLMNGTFLSLLCSSSVVGTLRWKTTQREASANKHRGPSWKSSSLDGKLWPWAPPSPGTVIAPPPTSSLLCRLPKWRNDGGEGTVARVLVTSCSPHQLDVKRRFLERLCQGDGRHVCAFDKSANV